MNVEGAVKYVKDKTVNTKRGPATTYAMLMDDDEWYNCGFKDPKVSKGDFVNLEYEVGAYGNDVKKVTPVTVAAPNSPQNPSSGGPKRKTFPLQEDDPDISMIRRSAAHLVASLYKEHVERALFEGRSVKPIMAEMLWMCDEYWTPYFTGTEGDFYDKSAVLTPIPDKLVKEDD